MRIRFHGADRTVTGSCHLIETSSNLRILLDFGLYQGPRDLARQINTTLPPDLKHIDAVILSHGHLDHCGRLPMLYRQGYRGPIYCTPATADVARVVLLDAAKIQEEDTQYLKKRSPDAYHQPSAQRRIDIPNYKSEIAPLFTAADVEGAVSLFKHTALNSKVPLDNSTSFTLHEAGHILGSTYILLTSDDKKLLFTGDIGRYNSPIINDPYPLDQAAPNGVDAIITESTYGTVSHAPMSEVGPQLLAILKETIAKRGRVLLPSFAVGRTQTMLWYVQRFIANKDIPPLPIFIDSPMGAEVTKITQRHADAFDEETRKAVCNGDQCNLFGLDDNSRSLNPNAHVSLAITADDSRAINAVRGPAVIIASSPTCEFGRILHHLKRSVEEPNDTIVFVGWTPPNTLGRALQNGSRRVRILDRLYDLRCQVKTLHGLSAHADGNELLQFLKPALKPSTVAFVVHGEEDRADGFASRLTQSGLLSASAPATLSCAVIGAAPTTTPREAVATDE